MSSLKQPSRPATKIWDLPIRIFHWGLVAAIATSWISMKLENMEVHVISGACVLGLLVFRLLWGIWGASTAQFHRFIPSPIKLLNYLRGRTADNLISIGHSPIAALSVIAMLAAIAFQTLTGLVSDDDVYTTGPLIEFVESDFSEWATGMHSTNSDILLGLMALHIAAILYYKFVKKLSLVKPMVTGVSAEQNQAVVANPLIERSWVVFFLTAAVSVAVPYVIFNLL